MSENVSHSSSAFGTMFGGALGCLAALVLCFVGLIVMCGGCGLMMTHNATQSTATSTQRTR